MQVEYISEWQPCFCEEVQGKQVYKVLFKTAPFSSTYPKESHAAFCVMPLAVFSKNADLAVPVRGYAASLGSSVASRDDFSVVLDEDAYRFGIKVKNFSSLFTILLSDEGFCAQNVLCTVNSSSFLGKKDRNHAPLQIVQ